MATAYSKRPSEFYHFETEIGAWAFDEACLITGRQIENAINEGKKPFERNTNGLSNEKSSGYKPAARHNMKRVKIKSNGTW